MKKKIQLFMQSWFGKWIFIPIVLFVVGVGLTFYYMAEYDNSFLILSKSHPESNYTRVDHEKLTKGKKVTGTFLADEDNLGIVAIRFEQFLRIPYKDEDTLVFRIKEHGAKTWYYQNTYKSGFTYDMPFLPFGFPLIENSKGKSFDFELESLYGNEKNAVVISKRQPNLASKYQVPKSQLTSDKKELVKFMIKKFFTSAQVIDILFTTIINLLPLLFYFVYMFLLHTKLRKIVKRVLPMIENNRVFVKYTACFLLFLILIDTLILQINNDILYIVIMSLWVVIFGSIKEQSKYSFSIGILFLVFTPLLFHYNNVAAAMKSSSWAFIFFITGVYQILHKNK